MADSEIRMLYETKNVLIDVAPAAKSKLNSITSNAKGKVMASRTLIFLFFSMASSFRSLRVAAIWMTA